MDASRSTATVAVVRFFMVAGFRCECTVNLILTLFIG